MCLILFAYRSHPQYRLLVAANRDEFYARPTAPMAFWEEAPDVLAGRDLAAGGTWLGVTRQGRFAAITNYRDPRNVRPDAPSRGALVSRYLQSQEPAWDYLNRLIPKAGDYNGFNLLLGDNGGLYYYSNQAGAPRRLSPGLYGLSNHLLDTPWPKVERGRQRLGNLLEQHPDPSPAALLELLTDRTPAPEEALPRTGVSLDWERILSPMFIASPDYGTRSSTVVRLATGGAVHVAEKTWMSGEIREFQFDDSCRVGTAHQ